MSIHKSRYGNAAAVYPSEYARRLPVPRERQEHARARVEARVGRGEDRCEQDGVNDVRGGTEPRAHEDDSDRGRGHVRVCKRPRSYPLDHDTEGERSRRTVRCVQERRVCPVDAQADREDREDVEEHDAHERRAHGARHGSVRCRGLARGEGDELDAAVGVEGVGERLCEPGEAVDEGLAVLEVGPALRTW